MTGQPDENVRRVIRDAMDRLIAGKPLHSDGKLTIKSLAEEARVKRWLLTHRHTDLKDEFRARIADTSAEPPAIRALQDETRTAAKKVQELTADVTALTATISPAGAHRPGLDAGEPATPIIGRAFAPGGVISGSYEGDVVNLPALAADPWAQRMFPLNTRLIGFCRGPGEVEGARRGPG